MKVKLSRGVRKLAGFSLFIARLARRAKCKYAIYYAFECQLTYIVDLYIKSLSVFPSQDINQHFFFYTYVHEYMEILDLKCL